MRYFHLFALSYAFVTSIFSNEPKPIYYVGEDSFSIDGYDFIGSGVEPDFIQEDRMYYLNKEARRDLPGDAYAELFTIVDAETGKSRYFQTRTIRNNDTAKITKVNVIKNEGHYVYGTTPEGCSNAEGYCDYWQYWTYEFVCELHLEHGEKLLISQAGRTDWQTDLDLSIHVNDVVRFEEQRALSANFLNTAYAILLIRDGKPIKSFGRTSNAPNKIVTGVARKDLTLHGDNPELYIINDIQHIDSLYWITFYDQPELIGTRYPATGHLYKGKQFTKETSPNGVKFRAVDDSSYIQAE